MKRSEITFSTLLVPIDFFSILAAEFAAYFIRFHPLLVDVRPVVFDLKFSTYVSFALGIAAIWVIIFACLGLYTMRGNRTLAEEIGRVFVGCSTGFVAVVIALFFQRELFQSRFILLAGWLFAILSVSVIRILVRGIQHILLRHGIGAGHLLVIGDGPQAAALLASLNSQPRWGFRVAHHLVGPFKNANDLEQAMRESLHRFPHIDGIFIADPTFSREYTVRVREFCLNNHLEFRYAADVLEAQALHVRVYPLAGIPLIELQRTPLEGWGRVAKRLFDIVGALFLIILFSPLMLVASLAIGIDSGRPILWSRFDDAQPVTRIGQSGQPFRYFKFRSMRPSSHSQRYGTLAKSDIRKGPLVKIVNDPRITRVGYYLRRFSIDELPEFFLVLAGSMSLVGPRPHLPEEVARYAAHHRRVLAVKPGITGLAQISGREHLSFDEEVTLDEYYIEQWSPWLDFWILLKTPWVVLTRPAL